MKKIFDYVKSPFKELKDIRSLTVCSMMIALSVITSVVLTFYPSITLKFSITFLFTAIIAMKYGPIIAATSAAITDIMQFLAKPMGGYLPLLTLTCAATGIIFGLFLYKNQASLWRIITSKFIISVFISTLLDSYILSIYFSRIFRELIISRGIKNLILFPIEILLLVVILKIVKKIDKTKK